MKSKIAVLIPCYNESKTIEKVIKDYKEALPEADIYVYDNNSTDGTDEIAKNINIDAGFISKMLPYLSVTNTTLPRVLCIDEFKGNSGNFKYQVALLDGETHKIVDIIECRHKHFLCSYFKSITVSRETNLLIFDIQKLFHFFHKVIHILGKILSLCFTWNNN